MGKRRYAKVCKICDKGFLSKSPKALYCCKECIAKAGVSYQRNYRMKHPEKCHDRVMRNRVKHYNDYLEYQRVYQIEYRNSDPVRKYKHQLRNTMNRCLKGYMLEKTGRKSKIWNIVGISIVEFYKHLVFNFGKEMVDLYAQGVLELDHIKPLKDATTMKEVDELFHFTNFRLIPRAENRTGRPLMIQRST